MKLHFRRPWRALALAAMALGLGATSALAQSNISSEMRGRVADPSGNPIAGATVHITHTPSGTTRIVTSRDAGQFSAVGLRIGGPFTVIATANGFQPTEIANLYTRLGSPTNVTVTLGTDDAQIIDLEDFVVTGRSMDLIRQDVIGTGSGFDSEQIAAIPTIERNVRDIARLDPSIVIVDEDRGELSAAGENYRYNSFLIDGVPANDEFGLEASGQPAFRQSFSMTTVESVQVSVTDYNVRTSGFTGAGVFATTKSGTNDFSGSLSYIFRDDAFTGNSPDGSQLEDYEEVTLTGDLGGPIIKDTLFFYVAYEDFSREQLSDSFADLKAQGDFDDITEADLNEIRDIAINQYGYDPGNLDSIDDSEEDEQIFVKLDWNINADHRAALQYRSTESADVRAIERGFGDFGFSNYPYQQAYDTEVITGQLFSSWTDNLESEINLSYNDYKSAPSFAQAFPQVVIEAGRDEIYLGVERFRHNNNLETQTLTGSAHFTYYMDEHTIEFGLDYKGVDIVNTFQQDGFGNYRFSNIDAFRNGDPEEYRHRYINPDNPGATVTADWAHSNWGFYAMNTWRPNSRLELTAGIRLDTPVVDDDPVFNQKFFDDFGVRNDATIDGNMTFAPRVGFRYFVTEDESIIARGGIGVFAGSNPAVWLSNSFTNTGNDFIDIRLRDADLNPGDFVTDPFNQPQPAGAVTSEVNYLDPDFQMPTNLRANFAFDIELPLYRPVTFTTEWVGTQVLEEIHYVHQNLGAPTGTLPDGRPIYGGRANDNPDYTEVLFLTNTDKGYGNQLIFKLDKPMENDDTILGNTAFTASYTYTTRFDVNSGTSSRAISNWNNRAVFDPNEEKEAIANNEIRHRFLLSARHQFEIVKDWTSTISVFYEGRSGRPYSFTFDNDANGDFIRDNDLLFVPATPDDVVWASPEDREAWVGLLEQNKYLRKHLGKVFPRNGARSPFVHQWDVSFKQNIPIRGTHKLELNVTIFNIGQLINDEWGQVNQVGFEYVAEVVDFEGIAPDGRMIYSVTRDENSDFIRTRDLESAWQMQVGLTYSF